MIILTTLEKYWPYLSILLLLTLLAVPFMWPASAGVMGMLAVALGVGALIVFSMHGHVKAYQAGRLDKAELAHNIAVDVPGLLLTMAVAAFAGRTAGQLAAEAAVKVIEANWPGWGVAAEILCGLLAGMLVGIAVGFVVKTIWGKLIKVQQRR